MPLIRRFSLTLLTLLATLWAGALMVIGCLLAARGAPEWIAQPSASATTAWQWLGAAILFAGQFVFMIMVADRLFPKASRLPIVWLAELSVVIAAVLSFAFSLLSGAAQGSI